MPDATAPPHGIPADEHEPRGRLALRALSVLLLPVISVLVTGIVLRLTTEISLPPPGLPMDLVSPVIPITITAVFFTAIMVLVRLGRPTMSALLLIGAWTLFTTLGLLRSGLSSPWPALLIMPICAAGLVIDGAASLSLAALATVLVAALGWLELRGLYAPLDQTHTFAVQLPALAIVGFWVALFWTTALLTSILAGELQRTLRKTREQAHALQELSASLEARVAAQTEELVNQAREAAMLEERTRLARDIHDTLAQGLTGIVVQLGAAQRALTAGPEGSREHLVLAQRLARESLAEARRSVWNLRAPALDRGDLADALRSVAVRPLGSDVAVTFELTGAPWPLTTAIESTLLRIAQEALANVARHSQATEAQLALIYAPDFVRLRISDNGIGFDPQTAADDGITPGPWGGFGLIGMRERIAALGGTLMFASQDGAQVVATIPRPGFAAPATNAQEEPA
jgi:signal transduction histidine kinase